MTDNYQNNEDKIRPFLIEKNEQIWQSKHIYTKIDLTQKQKKFLTVNIYTLSWPTAIPTKPLSTVGWASTVVTTCFIDWNGNS